LDSRGEALLRRLGLPGPGGPSTSAAHPVLRGRRGIHVVALSAGRVPQQHRLGQGGEAGQAQIQLGVGCVSFLFHVVAFN